MIVIYVERGSYSDFEFQVVGAVERQEDAAPACWHYAEKLLAERKEFWKRVPQKFGLHRAEEVFPLDQFPAGTVFLTEHDARLIVEPGELKVHKDDYHISWIETELWKP